MTAELAAKLEKLAAELNDANVAFILVVAVSGTSPRWWTNLARYSENAVAAIRHALNEAGHVIVARKNAHGSRIITPSGFVPPRA